MNRQLIFIFFFFSFAKLNAQILRGKDVNRGNIDQLADTALLKRINEKSANPPMQVIDREVEKESYTTFKKAEPEKVPLSVFGSSFFSTPSLSFEPNLRIGTPANYILGPDDELILNVSGYQEATIRVQVNPEGNINIPQVGQVNVAGLTIENATSRIRSKMSQTAYSNLRSGLTKLSVSLGKIRSIHITIIGAAKPGNYTVSSLTTVFNSLYLCGGPDNINSYREIELIRNNRVYQKIDLYKFLTRGDQSGNVLLRENDVINFPVYKKQVTLIGQIKRPAIFELMETETLNDLLFFAGGFTDKAYKASVKIKQVTDTDRKIKDLVKAEFAIYKPLSGDSIQVDAVLEKFENGVAIVGAVNRPGNFELTPGLTVGGLIRKADGLLEDVYMERAIISRTNQDKTRESIPFNVRNVLRGEAADILLQKFDEVRVASTSNFRSEYIVTLEGEVRKPGEYTYQNNLSLKDLLFNANGFTDAGSSYHIEVSRRIVADSKAPSDSIAEVFDIDTDKDFQINDSAPFILHPFDVITVRRNPKYTEQERVTIKGEVVYPGTYTIKNKKETISSLLKRAGGLTPTAYEEGAFLIRNISAQLDSNKLEKVRLVQQDLRDTSIRLSEDIQKTNVRIAIDINQVLNYPGSREDYALEEGDIVEILRLDPLVKLSGEVLRATKTLFDKGKSVPYYLGKAGGTTDNARKSKIYVLYASGEISKTNNGLFGLFRSYPKIRNGAEIIVPPKKDKRQLSPTETVGITSAIVSLGSLILLVLNSLSK